MGLFLGIKIKRFHLGFIRSQVTLPVFGTTCLQTKHELFLWVVLILLPLSSEVFRTHKTFPKCTLWIGSASLLQLFLACCWPLGSFSFRASSLHDHPTWTVDLVWNLFRSQSFCCNISKMPCWLLAVNCTSNLINSGKLGPFLKRLTES